MCVCVCVVWGGGSRHSVCLCSLVRSTETGLVSRMLIPSTGCLDWGLNCLPLSPLNFCVGNGTML